MSSINCYTCNRSAWKGDVPVADDGQEVLNDFAEASCVRADCPNTDEELSRKPAKVTRRDLEKLVRRVTVLEKKFAA